MAGTLLRLRYPAACDRCGRKLPRGTEASWDRERKAATCVSCVHAVSDGPRDLDDVLGIEIGEAAGSAAREWRRRHDRRLDDP